MSRPQPQACPPQRKPARLGLAALTCSLLAASGCDRASEYLIGVDGISAEALKAELAGEAEVLVLDVRAPGRFAAGHIPGAISLPPEAIDGYLVARGDSRETVIVAVCNRGRSSVPAAARAAAHGYRRVYSLQGGMTRWQALGLPTIPGEAATLDPELRRRPLVATSLAQELAIVVAAFGFKPIYMLLTFLLILWLRGHDARDLTLIRRGLVAFLVGEGACTLNYLVAADTSSAFEIAHGLGMVVMGVLVGQGLFHMTDHRLLRFSDPKLGCLMQRLCSRCWKRDDVGCGLRRLLHFALPALALISLLPLTMPLRPTNVTLMVFGDEVYRDKAMLVMILEFRLYPLLAALGFVVAALRMGGGMDALRRAEAPMFAAFGLMAFSLFRFLLYSTFHTLPLWSDFWEELTELTAVFGLAWFLFVFREPLGLPRPRFSAHYPKTDEAD